MVVHGDGGATRDFLHVADICDALERSLTADLPGGTTLHVATAVETSIDELAALCAEVAGRPDHPVEHAPARVGEVERNVASYRLAEQVLGFRPAVGLRDGLAGTWEWYREHVFR
jgi:UDP-glucose 4-epimerase